MTDKDKKKKDDNKIEDSFKFHVEESINIKEREIQLTGIIGDDICFEFVDAALTVLESQSRKGIKVKIYSTGGSVYEALAIVGRLTASHCQITTEGYGAIMSAATLILACGSKRRISQYTTFMHHESSYYLGGKHSEVREEIEQMEREEQLWAQWMEKFSALDAESWLKRARKKNWYLTAEECAKYKIVDEVF